MKMQYFSSDMDKRIGKEDKFYIGYYNDNPFIVSFDKNCVRYYMEKHRMLDPEDYIIMEDELDNYELLEMRDLVVYEHCGVYLPERDITMIQLRHKNMKDELSYAFHSLLNLARLIGQLGGKDRERDSMLQSAEICAKLWQDDKITDKLTDIDFRNDPLVYCSMEEYQRYLMEYEERIAAYDRWMCY